MKHPGDLTEEERNTAQDRFRAAAIEAWGKDRAAAIESVLNEAAAAVARLGKLRFSKDDASAFYLHEMLLGSGPEETVSG